MGRFFLGAAALFAVAGSSGCSTFKTNPGADLVQAMSTGHKTAINLFNRVNGEMQPFRIEQALTAPSFSKEDLFLIQPSDIAAWDDILTGLDAYCAALDELNSGASSAPFTAASESFGLKIQSLIRSAKVSDASSVGSARTAVSELGALLVQYKASRDARTIAKAADPSFQAVIRNLIDALGFSGRPPLPAPHGLLAACDSNFRAMNAENLSRRFKDDSIVGYDSMTTAERRSAIKDLIAWLGAQQDHEALIKSMTALAQALDKAAAAHASLAQVAPGPIDGALAELRTEIRITAQICQNNHGG